MYYIFLVKLVKCQQKICMLTTGSWMNKTIIGRKGNSWSQNHLYMFTLGYIEPQLAYIFTGKHGLCKFHSIYEMQSSDTCLFSTRCLNTYIACAGGDCLTLSVSVTLSHSHTYTQRHVVILALREHRASYHLPPFLEEKTGCAQQNQRAYIKRNTTKTAATQLNMNQNTKKSWKVKKKKVRRCLLWSV